jgi:hypothetical protein
MKKINNYEKKVKKVMVRESVVLQLPIKVICQFVQIQGIFSEALICM